MTVPGFYSPPTAVGSAVAIGTFSLLSLFVACTTWGLIRAARRRPWYPWSAIGASLVVGIVVSTADIFLGGPNSGLFSIFMLPVGTAYLAAIGVVAGVAAMLRS